MAAFDPEGRAQIVREVLDEVVRFVGVVVVRRLDLELSWPALTDPVDREAQAGGLAAGRRLTFMAPDPPIQNWNGEPGEFWCAGHPELRTVDVHRGQIDEGAGGPGQRECGQRGLLEVAG